VAAVLVLLVQQVQETLAAEVVTEQSLDQPQLIMQLAVAAA
jgi:hypothetical protein